MTTPTIFPIKPDAVIPFPCWLKDSRRQGSWHWLPKHNIDPHLQGKDWLAAGWTYYSTNGPDNRPGEVPASFATCVRYTPDGPTVNGKPVAESVPQEDNFEAVKKAIGLNQFQPHPTLEQLAGEAAAHLVAFGQPTVQEATAILIQRLSPEWERMGRELAAANGLALARLTQLQFVQSELVAAKDQWRMSSVCRELRAEVARLKSACDDAMSTVRGLEIENEKLTKELAEAHAETQEQARLLGAGGSREAALRGEVERLTRERDDVVEIARKAGITASDGTDDPCVVEIVNYLAHQLPTLRAQVRELEADSAKLVQAESLLREVLSSQPVAIDMRRHIFNYFDTARKETHP